MRFRVKKSAVLATLGFLAFDAAACDSFLLLAQVFGIFIMVLPPGPSWDPKNGTPNFRTLPIRASFGFRSESEPSTLNRKLGGARGGVG